jgi:plastocyanin
MRAKDFVPVSKPRNFVAKNQKTAGAGAHKDKKRAEKQGDVKHRNKFNYKQDDWSADFERRMKQGVEEGSAKPETLAKRAEWQKTPLTSNKIVIDGYTINFTPTALVISKGGKVLWKKEGNYSQPTNSTLAGAKKLVTGLSRQGQPDEKQMFGKVDPAELKARKEHRKKWQQASILSHEKKISFQQAWSQLFGGQGVEEATSVAVRMQRAADKQRAKSDASLARTPSSIPKKDQEKKNG